MTEKQMTALLFCIGASGPTLLYLFGPWLLSAVWSLKWVFVAGLAFWILLKVGETCCAAEDIVQKGINDTVDSFLGKSPKK